MISMFMKVKHAHLLTNHHLEFKVKLRSFSCLRLEALASHLHYWQRIVLLQPAQVTLENYYLGCTNMAEMQGM